MLWKPGIDDIELSEEKISEAHEFAKIILDFVMDDIADDIAKIVKKGGVG